MPSRGGEHISTMFDCAEQKDRATEFVLTTPTSHLRKKKRCSWSENNYRYKIKTDSDNKSQNGSQCVFKNVHKLGRERKEYRQLEKEVQTVMY